MKASFLLVGCLLGSLVAGPIAQGAEPQPSAAAGAVSAASPTPKPGEVRKTLQDYVQIALNQAFEDLGFRPASPERVVFENEVLTEPFVFVTNYRTNSEGTDVQVDKDKLKNFIRFSSTLFSGTNPAARLCVVVRAVETCTICGMLQRDVLATWTSRIEKRGFQAKPMTEVPEGAALSTERAFDYYLSRMGEAQCEGLVYNELSADEFSSDDDQDSVDQKIRSQAFLMVRDPAGKRLKSRGQSLIQAPKSLSVTDTGPIAKFASTLVGREAAELYQAAAAQVSTVIKIADDEKYLKLEGVTSFGEYNRFKSALQSSLPGLVLEERMISPGSFQFAVGGGMPLMDLVPHIRRIQLGPPEFTPSRELKIFAVGAQELLVVLR